MSDSMMGVLSKVDEIIHDTGYNYKKLSSNNSQTIRFICAHSKFIESEDNSNLIPCNSKSKFNSSSDVKKIKCKANLQFKLDNDYYYTLVENNNCYHNHLPPEVSFIVFINI